MVVARVIPEAKNSRRALELDLAPTYSTIAHRQSNS